MIPHKPQRIDFNIHTSPEAMRRLQAVEAAAFIVCERDTSRPESFAILIRRDEGLDHFSRDVIAVELIQLTEPEIIAAVIQRRLRRIVWIAPQVADVLG